MSQQNRTKMSVTQLTLLTAINMDGLRHRHAADQTG